MNAPQYILYTFPKDATDPLGSHAYGPDSQATCEAAVQNVDIEAFGWVVLPCEPLPVAQSPIVSKMDEVAAARARDAASLGGFS